MKPLFSIVIPIYNSSKYLPKCLDSIVNQSFQDFELILVNDGSNDASIEICQSYAETHCCIRIIDQPNQGVSVARNNGLKAVQGKYVTFIDSDDFIEKDYLLHFYMEGKDADLIVGGFIQKNEDDNVQSDEQQYLVKGDFQTVAEKILQLEKHFLLSGPFAKCFRHEIIKEHDLQFDKRFHFGEDALFNLSFCNYVQSIALCKFSGYYYIQRAGDSLVKRKYSFDQTNLFAETISQYRIRLKEQFKMSDNYDNIINREKTLFKISALSAMYSERFALPRKQRLQNIGREQKSLYLSALPNTSYYYKLLKVVFSSKTPVLIDPLLKLMISYIK